MATRRRRYSAGTARRKLIWARSLSLDSTATPAAGVAHDLLAQFRTDGGSSLGATVTRVRIDFTLVWTLAAATDIPFNSLAVGAIVDQLQLDQTEVPRPGDEEHADWMFWKRFSAVPEYSALTGTAGVTVTAHHAWDIRSQRKVEELGQTLWFVVDPTYTGSNVLSCRANASVLLKLP